MTQANANFEFNDILTVTSNLAITVRTNQNVPSRNVLDFSGKTDGIIIPYGTSDDRPLNPNIGTLRFNMSIAKPEIYIDNEWQDINTDYNILQDITPKSLPHSTNTATVTGTNLVSGMVFEFVGATGIAYLVPSWSLINSTTVVISRPPIMPVSQEPFTLRATLPSGPQFELKDIVEVGEPPIIISPPAGSLGIFPVNCNITPLLFTAYDADGSNITNISKTSDASGLQLLYNNNNTATLSGITSNVSSSTTFNFTISAMDTGSNIVARGYSIMILSYPSGPWAVLEASALSQANNTSIAAWGSTNRIFSQSTEANKPTYMATGGYNNGPYVYFNRTNSAHLNAGSQTLNISTNGGFTTMFLIKFVGTAGAWERVIDFGNGAPSDNIIISRNDATQNFRSVSYNSTTALERATTTNPIVQEEWCVLTFRYTKQSSIQLWKNNVMIDNGSTSTDLLNRTLANTYIGRSHWADVYLNAHISKLFIYDRALSDGEMTTLYNHMTTAT